MENNYVIEMLHITKRFPGIVANDDITLRLKKGEIHALLGENGAGKSTLMSVLFGLYTPEEGEIKKDGEVVEVKSPNDATALHIGMVHQHFKLVEIFSVLDNIILGAETTKYGYLDRKTTRDKIEQLSKKYGLYVDLDAKIEDITVGMQQRVEILKMLYRDNDILIFDEPTAVLTPQEIDELMQIMRNLAKEGKSILFITHKLDEIMAVADFCTILRKGKVAGEVKVSETTKEELSEMMVGRKVQLAVDKKDKVSGEPILQVKNLCMFDKIHKILSVKHVSFEVKRGEILCIAGIDGNGQSDLIYGITGIEKAVDGEIYLNGKDITNANIRKRNLDGIAHIPEDRHKYGLVLDYPLDYNLVLEKYFEKPYSQGGFLNEKAIREYSDELIEKNDIRSGQGSITKVRSMSGGNQQKAIVARELDRGCDLVVAVQPTRGLDVGAIENVHRQLVKERDENKAVLLVSLELDEVLSLSDRILVIHKGELVGEFDPRKVTRQELGLYMAGAKRDLEKFPVVEETEHEKK